MNRHRRLSGAVKTTKEIIITPSALEFAKENWVDLTLVKGSGKKGSIVKKDVVKGFHDQEHPQYPGNTVLSVLMVSNMVSDLKPEGPHETYTLDQITRYANKEEE